MFQDITKTINLMNGGSALVDADDYERLRGFSWLRGSKGYANFSTAPTLLGNQQDITNITEALGVMISNLLQANVPVTLNSGVFFFSPRTYVYLKTLRNPTTGQFAFPELQAADPRLLGYKVAFTSQIPINPVVNGTGGFAEAYFSNMPDMIIGESANLMLDVSSEAAYVDANGNTISAFSQDQTVIRVIKENDFAVRYTQSVSVMTGISF